MPYLVEDAVRQISFPALPAPPDAINVWAVAFSQRLEATAKATAPSAGNERAQFLSSNAAEPLVLLLFGLLLLSITLRVKLVKLRSAKKPKFEKP